MRKKYTVTVFLQNSSALFFLSIYIFSESQTTSTAIRLEKKKLFDFNERCTNSLFITDYEGEKCIQPLLR